MKRSMIIVLMSFYCSLLCAQSNFCDDLNGYDSLVSFPFSFSPLFVPGLPYPVDSLPYIIENDSMFLSIDTVTGLDYGVCVVTELDSSSVINGVSNYRYPCLTFGRRSSVLLNPKAPNSQKKISIYTNTIGSVTFIANDSIVLFDKQVPFPQLNSDSSLFNNGNMKLHHSNLIGNNKKLTFEGRFDNIRIYSNTGGFAISEICFERIEPQSIYSKEKVQDLDWSLLGSRLVFEKEIENINVYKSNGQLVLKLENLTHIELNDLPRGLLIFEIFTNDKTLIKKGMNF